MRLQTRYQYSNPKTKIKSEPDGLWARSQNCDKRLLASSFLSVCLCVWSARPRGTTRLPPGGFLQNLIFENFSKISRENAIFIKV